MEMMGRAIEGWGGGATYRERSLGKARKERKARSREGEVAAATIAESRGGAVQWTGFRVTEVTGSSGLCIRPVAAEGSPAEELA